MAVYTCPSDSPSASPTSFNGVTFFNYVGNFGNTTVGRNTPVGVNSNGTPNVYGGAPFVGLAETLADMSPTRLPPTSKFAGVTDGLSNTLLFSETVQGKGGDLRGFAWWGWGAHFETLLPPNSNEPDVIQNCRGPSVDPSNPPCTLSTNANGSVRGQTTAARSRHIGSVGAALCDGSVRFVSESINLDTWRWLGSARGGEVVSGEF
jgi:hypothetical protein